MAKLKPRLLFLLAALLSGLATVGYDIHRLDGDRDGVTCKRLP